jgi:protein required for attachment to host cells
MSEISERLTKVSRSSSPLTTGTWVLVADSEKAMLLENIGDADLPVLELRKLTEQSNPATHDQGSDRPGRRMDSGPGQRSAMEETDWHRLEQDRFAEGLADMLRRAVARHDITRLILVAGPRVLGALRAAMHAEVSSVVVAEVGQSLTHHPLDEVARHVTDATRTGL